MRYLVLTAAAAATVGFCAQGFAAGLVKDDVALGLSNINAANNGGNSIDIARGQPTGANAGFSWTASQAFVQSTQFDNIDGIRHNAKGNLVGLTFGATATGGTLINLDTRFAVNPGVATQFFDFATYNTANPGAPLTISRLGGLTVSPNNQRLAVVASDQAGVIVFDYTAGDSNGLGAAVSNGRELTGQFRTGSTQGATWLDNNRIAVADGNGFLKIVDTSGSLSVSTATTYELPYVATVSSPFTSLAYEPTISPFVYLSINQFSGAGGTPPNTSFNRMYVFDPNNNFAQVGSANFSSSAQSARELAFSSAGDLYVSVFGQGTITASVEAFRNAFNPANITADGSVDYYTSAGTASFNGVDIAMSAIDYVTPDTNVNLRDDAVVQPYFAASPLATIKAKIASGYNGGAWNGPGIRSSVAAATAGTGIGYKELAVGSTAFDSFADATLTTSRTSLYVAYTLLGDANIDFMVDIGDFATLASNFNETGDWADGDFDYNGTIDIGDFAQLASNFNETLSTGNRSAVPEPAAGVLAAALLLWRRRR